MMKPSLEDVQATLNKAIQMILKMSEAIPQWEHMKKQQKQQQKVGSGIKGLGYHLRSPEQMSSGVLSWVMGLGIIWVFCR